MALQSLNDTDSSLLRILLVEDSSIDRDLTRRLLTLMWPHRSELKVDFAYEGSEAFDMICATSYALMLLDWRLPGMDGGALLNLLDRSGRRLPVVVLTGMEREELPRNFDARGAVYLHKDNLNLATLHQSIATALSNVLRSSADNTIAPTAQTA
jgi:CheY-like chemotaxis protein